MLAEDRMSPPVAVAIRSGTSRLNDERSAAVVDFLRRVERVEHGLPPPTGMPIEVALARLSERAQLFFQPDDDGATVAYYVGSRQSLHAIRDGVDAAAWPEQTQRRHLQAIRFTEGAIFRFPYENGEGSLEVFITDWSPCPAACAVAVHPFHPAARGTAAVAGNVFTGKYVRHPLTGDLLPVWIAGWVRPDFGTGAVLVNPAHDPVDLQFGRTVGLPIRFALLPESFTGDPGTWPNPPILRAGRSIRTGCFDGLTAEDAARAYFEALQANGLAYRHTDVRVAASPVARLVPDLGGSILWSPRFGLLMPRMAGASSGEGRASETLRAMRPEALPALVAVAAIPADRPVILVTSVTAQEGALLHVRLMFFDLHEKPLNLAQLCLVQAVQETKDRARDPIDHALLVGAPVQQTLVLRSQLFEQVERFWTTHRDLLSRISSAPCPDSARAAVRNAVRTVKGAIVRREPAAAFSALYALQKQLRTGEPRYDIATLGPYFAVASVLMDTAVPPGADVHTAWAEIQ